MSRTYQDSIRLDFQVTTKGQDQLNVLAKDLDRVTNSINKLNEIGTLLDNQSKGFSDLSRRIGMTNKALKRLEDQTNKVGQAGKKSSKKLVLFGEDVGQLAGKITLFATLTGAIVKTLGFIANQAKSVSEIEDAMARVGTVTRATSQTLQGALFDIRKEVLKTSRDVKLGFTEISVAAFAAGSAGLNVAQQMAAIRPITDLVVGTLGDMEFTSKLVTGSFNVFSEKLGDASTDLEKFQAISDIIADTFSRQQIELSELEAGFRLASSAVSLLDVQFDELVTTLGFLNTGLLKGSRAGTALLNAVIKLAKNSDKVKEAFNVAIDPTKPLKFKDLITQIADQIKEGGVSTEEFRKLIDIFGIRGARAVAQIVNDMDRYEQAVGRSQEATKNMAAVLSKIQTRTLTGSFGQMKNAIGETLVLLNDIIPVTRILSGIFLTISATLGKLNNALSSVAKVTSNWWNKFRLFNDKTTLGVLRAQLASVNHQIDDLLKKSERSGGLNLDGFDELLSKRKEIEDSIDAQKKLIKTLSGDNSNFTTTDKVKDLEAQLGKLKLRLGFVNEQIEKLNGESPQFRKDNIQYIVDVHVDKANLLKEVETIENTLKGLKAKEAVETIPESVKAAAKHMEQFVLAGDKARGVNGDIFEKVLGINTMMAGINKRIQENSSLSNEVKESFKGISFEVSKTLEFSKDQKKTIIDILGQSTKHVASESEVQKIFEEMGKVITLIRDRRKEIADLAKESLLAEQERFQLELLKLQGAKDEELSRQASLFRLQEFNELLGTNLSLEEARKMTHAELITMAGQNEEALKAANELEKEINNTIIARKEYMMEVAEQANELANKVNDTLRDSLYESLKNAEKLDDAFKNAAKAVGDILLKQQFDNLFAQLNKHFNLGAVTIETQIGKGGQLFIQQLDSEMPRIAAMSGKIFADNASTGLTNASQTLNAAGGTGDAANLLNGATGGGAARGGGSASQGGSTFGNVAGGALSGYALAQSQGQGTGATVGSVAGAAIGNAIVPGIGGLVGGFLGGAIGGLFDKKKKPEPPKRETEPFKLDVANTHLDNINRNLVGLRQDTRAYSLPTSFYFSATQQNPLASGITINGDFIFNGVAPSGEPGDAIGQFEQSMSNILAEQINRGAQ